ncbi:MAG TPA: hypothetical protein PLM75_06040, partial [bacterium]|nr:hypothetical protein [bacterium]
MAIVYFTAIFGFCGLLYKLFFRIIFCILFLIAFANLIKKIKIYSAALVDYSKEIILKINIYQKIVILAVLPIVLVNILMSISPEIFYDS